MARSIHDRSPPRRLPSALKSAAVAVAMVSAASPAGALSLRLEAEAVRFGTVSVERLTIEGAAAPEVHLRSVSHRDLGALGDFRLVCDRSTVGCAAGQMRWSVPDTEPVAIGFERGSDGLTARAGDARIEIQRGSAGEYGIDADSLPLAWLLRLDPFGERLSQAGGVADARMRLSDGSWSARLSVRGAGFDTPDGWAAGASLDARVSLNGDSSGAVDAEATWSGGELLVGAAYLPPPDPAIRIRAVLDARSARRIERIEIDAGDDFRATGRAIVPENGWGSGEYRLESIHADLAWLWRQGLGSLAAARGWDGLSPLGRLRASGTHAGGKLRSLSLELTDVSLDDRDERLSLSGLGLAADWRAAPRETDIRARWASATVYRVPLGESRVELRSTAEADLELIDPWRIPIMDGALVVEQLQWRAHGGDDGNLKLDARLEPIALQSLTQRFGWPAMGGTVAGRFPGIRLASDGARLDGGMRVDLFDGTARIEGLSLERPFGRDPALSADVFLEALDLNLLTRAFEFGSIRGLLSGRIVDLRLLNWMPVRFDAWFETLQRSPEREISQRAVDSLSSLSGGGGAAVSGILMRWFDSFPYSRIGLGCRLTANVCEMRGLRQTDSGGYLILEGRAVPRLDIVGYQRRVDWPRLIEQLRAATAGGAGVGSRTEEP